MYYYFRQILYICYLNETYFNVSLMLRLDTIDNIV